METISLQPALHRCDACSAAAKLVAIKDEAILMFCGHHGAKNMVALASNGFVILKGEE